MKFQAKRGYTEGLLSKLNYLQNIGKIEIVKVLLGTKYFFLGHVFPELIATG